MTVLNEQLARLQARYLASPLPAFLGWWRDELLALLPANWRQRLWPPRARVFVTLSGQRMHLWRASGDHVSDQEPLILDLDQDADLARDEVRQLLASYEGDPPHIIFCLASEHVLSRRLTMPAAAESALGPALAFEMDRHTPFGKEDVYFDFRIVGREKDENLISLDLYVTRREVLDRASSAAQLVGLGLEAVDMNSVPADQPPRPEGVNLLPPERRHAHRSRRSRLNWALAGATVILLAVVMAESLYLQERTIERLEGELEASQQEVRIVRRLRGDLEDALAAAGFLGERKREAPSVLGVLSEVTLLLPEDTWVQRMQITGTELQLQGLSDGAQKLIEVLNSAASLEDTYFKGATTTDQRLNKERFTVAADIIMSPKQPQEPDDAATSGP